jgi:hypothetical protein
MNIDRLVAVYVKMRDEKARIRKEADEKCADIAAKMDRIEAEILRHLQTHNMESARTEAGTVFKKVVVKPSVKDWFAYDTWLAENGVHPSDAYEKRVSSKFISEYMAEHDGAMPAGVAVHQEYVVQVRRGNQG